MSKDFANDNSASVSGRIEKSAEMVRQMKAADAKREEILTQLALIAEALSGPDSAASILVLDDKGLLRNVASPKLPADYLAAIDGIKPHPNLGTCAAAAATGRIVITTDFLADSKWAELRQLPLGIGYMSAWSVPIKNDAGLVLGTFGTYFRARRPPTPEELAGVQALAKAAAIALL